jgi:hypothetical protein
VGVDERNDLSDLRRGQSRDYLFGRPSSSVAKKIEAAFKVGGFNR